MFSLPTASSIVSSSTEYSTTLFTEFLPFLFLVVGVTGAVVLLVYLKRVITGGIRKVGGQGKGGKRRRK